MSQGPRLAGLAASLVVAAACSTPEPPLAPQPSQPPPAEVARGTPLPTPAVVATDAASIPREDLDEVEPRVARFLKEAIVAAESDPSVAAAWGHLGAAYDVHGLAGPAEKCYRAARELDPSDFRWSYLLAVLRDSVGAPAEEIVELYSAAERVDADYPPLAIRFGHALSLRGRAEEAKARFEHAVKLAPDLAPGHRGLGQVLLSLGDADGAVRELEIAASLEPRDASTHSALASAYLRLGQTDRARAAAERSTKIATLEQLPDPLYADNVTALGQSLTHRLERAQRLLRQSDPEGALKVLASLREDRPQDAHVLYLAATAERRVGRPHDAERTLLSALDADPEHLGALLELAGLQEERGDLRAARDTYLRARQIDGRDPALLAGLAQVLARGGDDVGAVGVYEELDQLRELDARLETNWANALLRTGRPGEAVLHYRKAIEADPRFANAHYNLGLAYERTGRTDLAVEAYRGALAIDPRHPAGARLRRLGG